MATGTASFTIAAGTLGNGANTLTATYPGDTTYAVASSTTTVTVEPVSISTTVPSPVNPGSSTTSTVTLTGSGGYSGTMNLSCSLTSTPTGAQSLPTCALNPASVTLASGGSGTSTLTVKTTAASTTALAGQQTSAYGSWVVVARCWRHCCSSAFRFVAAAGYRC